ncbi:MAG: magnesium transporter MgtE N-terminal domain-containing protein [Chloroflexota bacterium]
MTQRQLLWGFLIFTGFFVTLIASTIAVYKIKPELLGLEPMNKGYKQNAPVPPEKMILISEDRLREMERLTGESEKANRKITDAMKREKLLWDSLYKLSATANYGQGALKRMRDSIEAMHKLIAEGYAKRSRAEDSLKKFIASKLPKENNPKNGQARGKDGSDPKEAAKADSIQRANFTKFAKIYDLASPAQVAKTLEKIGSLEAAKIIKLMKPKQAAKTLEAMDPEKAAAILLVGG